MRACVLALLAVLTCAGAEVLPTPQSMEPLPGRIEWSGPVRVWSASPISAEILGREIRTEAVADARNAQLILWNYSADAATPVPLNFLERQVLLERPQGYVLRAAASQPVIIAGGSAQGVLWGVTTLLQLVEKTPQGVSFGAIAIRDFPDFELRGASDWLLHAEVNRWALDRGQGVAPYRELVKKKLERAMRFKINMVLIDGFGWSLQNRFAGYAELMRDLNRFARDRGMKLLYGGYGAAYDSAQSAGDYQGNVFLNRESYPDGATYQCLAFPPKKKGLDPRTMGGCRGNDELNRLKAEDLAHFVHEVEPGALYIHHEDCCIFEDFQKAWLGRCERCRRRWPSDSLLAANGGAGALAHGYSALIDGVNRVRRESFLASRDTEIILVSPVYMPMTSRSDDWGQVLELWRNIVRLLPKVNNVQIAFREILPQAGGGKRWIELFSAAMQRERLPFRAFLFQVGGADGFLTDYGFTGAPAMNAHFLGAKSIYNATGDPYREPLELLAAEYSWNTHSSGFFRNPAREADMDEIVPWVYEPGFPVELYGPGKLFDRICARLYGDAAGREMSQYYRENRWLPEGPVQPSGTEHPYYRTRRGAYLPRAWNRVTSIPSYWNHYLLDSRTWQPEVTDEGYLSGLKALGIDVREAHRRLMRRWTLAAELNTRGREHVQRAIQANPPADARADLEFLVTLFDLHATMIDALRAFHEAAYDPSAKNLFDRAEQLAQQVDEHAAKAFPYPVDPAVGEVRTLREYPKRLLAAISEWKKR